METVSETETETETETGTETRCFLFWGLLLLLLFLGVSLAFDFYRKTKLYDVDSLHSALFTLRSSLLTVLTLDRLLHLSPRAGSNCCRCHRRRKLKTCRIL